MNAGRNTNALTTHAEPSTSTDELGDESADSEARFLEHVRALGIRLADWEDE